VSLLNFNFYWLIFVKMKSVKKSNANKTYPKMQAIIFSIEVHSTKIIRKYHIILQSKFIQP